MTRALIFAVSLLSVLALACGNSDDGSTGGNSSSGDEGGGAAGGTMLAGMVVPDTHLTFEGEQYVLVEVLQADLLDEEEFSEVGATREADIDFSEALDVYRREGDPNGVYTYQAGEGSGDEALPASWLHWVPVASS